MNDDRRIEIRRRDLDRAVSLGLVETAAADALWRHLCRDAPPAGPRFDFTHILYYLGGLLAIGAATLFMTEGFQRLGPWGLFAIALAYLAGCVRVAGWLDGRGLAVPAGLIATLAVCLVPLATWALQHGLGLWPDGGPQRYAQYHTRIDWRWLTLELSTLAAAAVALWRLRHPFLMMPVAVTLWYLSMDLARLVVAPDEAESWAFYRDFSVFFGALMLAFAFWVDARSRAGSRLDYAFWPYLMGMLTFWVALTARRSDDEFARLLYGLLNLGLIGVAAVLRRRVFAVFGALGVAIYLGHLSARVFRDSLLFPLALTLIGLAVVACGVAWQRHEARIEAALRSRLPAALQRWLPR